MSHTAQRRGVRRAAIAVALLVLVSWWLARPAASGAAVRATAGQQAGSTTVVVGPGDTLWDIAAGVTPAGGSVHETVAQIAEANGVDPVALRPGQPLTIPLP